VRRGGAPGIIFTVGIPAGETAAIVEIVVDEAVAKRPRVRRRTDTNRAIDITVNRSTRVTINGEEA
jgi:hypothetical protein